MGLDTISLSAVIVFLIFVIVSGLITYHKIFCTCICKQRNGGFFIDSIEESDGGTEEDEEVKKKLKQFECCCCICLINKKLDVTKYVYVREGHKSVYNSMTESTCSNVNSVLTINEECSICLEEFTADSRVVTLTCGHGYHKKCIREWIVDKNDSKCPLCARKIASETVTLGTFSVESHVRMLPRNVFYYGGTYV